MWNFSYSRVCKNLRKLKPMKQCSTIYMSIRKVKFVKINKNKTVFSKNWRRESHFYNLPYSMTIKIWPLLIKKIFDLGSPLMIPKRFFRKADLKSVISVDNLFSSNKNRNLTFYQDFRPEWPQMTSDFFNFIFFQVKEAKDHSRAGARKIAVYSSSTDTSTD